MPAYSGGNRWVGVVSGAEPPVPPDLVKLAKRTLEQAETTWREYGNTALASYHQWSREQVRDALALLGVRNEGVPARTVHVAGDVNLTFIQAARILRRVGKSYVSKGMTDEAQIAKRLKKKFEGSLNPPSTIPLWLAADMMTYIAALA